MKFRFAVCLFFTSLCLLGLHTSGQAQTIPAEQVQTISPAVPVPPAFIAGQRLLAESNTAIVEAHRLYTINDPGASFVHELAHSKAFDADKKFQEVVASRTYGQSPYAGEALYYAGQIQAYYLYDKQTAVQTYTTIRDKFAGIPFPHKQAALAQLPILQAQADQYNKTHLPQKYFYSIFDFLVTITGRKSYSYPIAIFLISVLVKLALTPLTRKQYGSMKEQQRLQPLIKEIQGKYKDDKQLQGQKMMDLYREHGINPAAGCVPLLAQMPILWGLYYMIQVYKFQFSHGTFLWIGSSLAHVYPAFLGIDLSQPDIPILLLYAGSMYVQQRMMVPPDPQQAEQARMMAIMTPFMSTYFFLQYHLPSAFVLYYLIFNVLSTGQQYYYMKHRTKGEAPIVASGNDSAINISPGSNGSKPYYANGAKPKNSAYGADNGTSSDIDVKPTARGAIAPKVHPKKKRR